MYQTLLLEKKDGIATLTLNRPDVYNAFDDTLSYELQDALKSVSRDKEVRVVVITGAGKAFCSGQDLKAIAGSADRSLGESVRKRYNPIIRAICGMPKPVIARLNGVAAGAGCSLALACDMIIASEKASLIEVFVNIGLVLDSGSSWFLMRATGYARAFELAATGRKLSASEALEWGLVNRVVAPEELDNAVEEVVANFAKAPTIAIGLIKKMLNKAAVSDLETMLEYEAYCQEIAGRTEDYRKGVEAFLQKRKPRFRGC